MSVLDRSLLDDTSLQKAKSSHQPFYFSNSFLGEVRIDFSEIESCFTEIQHQVTKRRHFKKQTNESGLRDP